MYLKVIVVSFLLLLLGAVVGFLGFPLVFEELVRRNVHLKPGSETRQLWQHLPFPLSFRIYVFNVTNAREIEQGGRPQLQELGPLVFDEWKDKYDVPDIEEQDAISFKMRNTFQFRPNLGLSGKELVTMPHPLLQFMILAQLGQSAEQQAGIALGLLELLKPQSAFITATLMELFFDGFDINCQQEHPAAQAICQQFQAGAVPCAMAVNATHYKFSLLGAAMESVTYLLPLQGNHTNAGEFKVSRSRLHKSSVGRVLAFNGAQQLEVWPDANATSSCNRLRGTDGTIFPPYMRPKHGLWSFSAQLCRSLTPKWTGSTRYHKLPAQRYELSFGSAKLEPDLHCFCTDFPTDCPADGTMDLMRCNGLPFVASLPHFHLADEKLLQHIEGLTPSADKHASVVIFEQLSGTVLSAHNRLQFSLQVQPVQHVLAMSQLRALTMPLFWIEESLQLDESITKILHKKIYVVLNANNVFRWLAIGLGSLGCALGGLFLHLSRSDAKRVGVSESSA
ncbi:hypothetical protein KR222_000056 [Zaprionus bogoriensis]|nr:hypothetical protein KR222_000056 [Zaprionus bogoriensis]